MGRGGIGSGLGGGGRYGGGGKGGGGAGTGSGDQSLAELEDRKTMIAERRRRLSDTDREANQEARLAAARLDGAVARAGDDIR